MTNRIVDETLSLPADARLNLIEKLLASLNLPVDEEIDRLWAEEAVAILHSPGRAEKLHAR